MEWILRLDVSLILLKISYLGLSLGVLFRAQSFIRLLGVGVVRWYYTDVTPASILHICDHSKRFDKLIELQYFINESGALTARRSYIECGGFRSQRYGFGHYRLLYARNDITSSLEESDFIAIAGIGFGRYKMCSPTCDLCRLLDNPGVTSVKQVCQMVLMDHDFPLRRCCTEYGKRTALQSTALQGTQRVTVQSLLQNTPSNTAIRPKGLDTAMRSTGQTPAPHRPKGSDAAPAAAARSIGQTPASSHRPKGPDAAARSTGQASVPHTDGASHRPKGPDAATRGPDAAARGTGQAPALHKADGASHKPKGPDAVTRSKGQTLDTRGIGQAPASNKAKGASSTQCWRTGLERGEACGTGPDDGPWDARRHDCM